MNNTMLENFFEENVNNIPTASGMAKVFLAFLVVVMLIILLKKLVYRIIFKKRYFIFPKTSVKGITSIAMVISISIAAILLLTLITAQFMGVIFRAYPGYRVTLEGVLIKIGGLLFGPILGLFIGGMTDLLSVALTAGMFHYGYLIAAMAFGFFAGLIRTLMNISKNKEIIFTIYSSFFIFFVLIIISAYIGALGIDNFDPEILSIKMHFSKEGLILLISLVLLSIIFILWLIMFIFFRIELLIFFQKVALEIRYNFWINFLRNRLVKNDNLQKTSYKHLRWWSKNQKGYLDLIKKIKTNEGLQRNKQKKVNWFFHFAPVLVTVFTGEPLIEIIMMPPFDCNFTPLPFSTWLSFRLVVFCFISFFNVAIIYPVYKIVQPTVNYDYQKDLTESIDRPLEVE